MTTVATIEATHGVLFISDPSGREELPPDTSAAAVTFTDSCIAFWAMHYVDGPVSLRLISRQEETQLSPAFTGRLYTPSGRVCVSQPDGEIIFDFTIPARDVAVSIFVDASDSPEVVDILITPFGVAE